MAATCWTSCGVGGAVKWKRGLLVLRWTGIRIRSQAGNTGTSALQVARLRRRENAELKEIVGLFALEKKRAEENQRGS